MQLLFRRHSLKAAPIVVHLDGSISTIVPVRDAVYKRLQLLERQLVRHTHHFAGLNPRAFRCIPYERAVTMPALTVHRQNGAE